jgi:hypothetical protein
VRHRPMPTVRRLAPVALLALLALAAVPASADPPWPDEWPIVVAPLITPGVYPPSVVFPGAPDAPPTGPGRRILERLREIADTVRDTRYQHRISVNPRRGRYRFDCSLMAHWILRRTFPRAVRHLEDVERPLARHFARTLERAPTDRFRRGWRRVPRIQDVRPGDVFAWRRPDGFPSRNTGHVGFVLRRPLPVAGIARAYAVRIADATRGGHQDDTRPWPGDGGFGTGTIVFLADAEGRGTHYGWSGTRSEGYVETPILFARLGP